MREKQQAVLSWLVIFLVLVGIFFPLRALFSYRSAPAQNPAQPTVAAMLTTEITTKTPAPTIYPVETKTPKSTQPVEVDTSSIESVFPEGPLPSVPEKISPPETTGEESQSVYPFGLQPGSPRYLPPFTYTGQDCRWLGIAGQVFDEQAQPLAGLAVFVSGTLEGQLLNLVAVTGSHPAYGSGGYEIILSDHIPSTPGELTVQLYDLSGNPVSEPSMLPLPEQCGQNLMLVNYRAGNDWEETYLPFVSEP